MHIAYYKILKLELKRRLHAGVMLESVCKIELVDAELQI